MQKPSTLGDEKKPKRRLRRRDLKKIAVITVYSFVAIVMVMGMVAPGLQ